MLHQEKQQKNKKTGASPFLWQKIGWASTVGLVLVASTFIGLFIGYKLDKILNTKPWLTIIFLLFGIVAGFLNIFKYIKK